MLVEPGLDAEPAPGPTPQNVDEPVRYVNWCQAAGYCTYRAGASAARFGGGSVAAGELRRLLPRTSGSTPAPRRASTARPRPAATPTAPRTRRWTATAPTSRLRPGPASRTRPARLPGRRAEPARHERQRRRVGRLVQRHHRRQRHVRRPRRVVPRRRASGLRCDSGRPRRRHPGAQLPGNDVGFRCCL